MECAEVGGETVLKIDNLKGTLNHCLRISAFYSFVTTMLASLLLKTDLPFSTRLLSQGSPCFAYKATSTRLLSLFIKDFSLFYKATFSNPQGCSYLSKGCFLKPSKLLLPNTSLFSLLYKGRSWSLGLVCELPNVKNRLQSKTNGVLHCMSSFHPNCKLGTNKLRKSTMPAM